MTGAIGGREIGARGRSVPGTTSRLVRRVAIVYLSVMSTRPGAGPASPSTASSPAPSTAAPAASSAAASAASPGSTVSPASPASAASPASVILVGGGKDQLSKPAAARDLYVSPLFASRRARAEASGVPWFIVSGRWGLLDPGDVLVPYGFSFAQQSVNYQRAWGRFVAEQLCLVSAIGRGDVVDICVGAAYTAALTAPIEYLGARVRRVAAGASTSGDEPR